MQDQQASERKILRNKLRQIVETRRIEDQDLERRSIRRERLSLQPIHSVTQNREGQRILFRLRKRREAIKTCEEDQYQVYNDSTLTRSKYKSPLNSQINSRKNMQSQLMSKKVQSMMASINRSTKIQSKQKKERRSQVQLIRSTKKKINNRKICSIWAQRSQVMVRKYGQQLQSFQKQLQDRYISDRITNMKASSDLSLTNLDKEYKEHQLMVHLREQFKVVSQKHRRRKSQR